jgi:hypothetical protein
MGVTPGFPFLEFGFKIKKSMNTNSRQEPAIRVEGGRGHVHLDAGKMPGNRLVSDNMYYDFSSFVNFSLANTLKL